MDMELCSLSCSLPALRNTHDWLAKTFYYIYNHPSKSRYLWDLQTDSVIAHAIGKCQYVKMIRYSHPIIS